MIDILWSRAVRLTLSASIPLMCAVAAPRTADAQTTALFLDSQPGDSVGQGLQYSYTPAHAPFAATRNSKNGVTISVIGSNFSFYWYLNFSAAGDVPLTVGSYGSATRQPFATGNGLDVFGMNRGCGDLTGRFVVRDIVTAPDGSVLKFAADFEQLCGSSDGALFGAVRYDSSIGTLLPFDGAYPVYQLAIAPDEHGRVISSGVDCGSGASTCSVTLTSPAQLTLTAVADAGYEFVRWTGDCAGGITTWIRVNTVKMCSAVFEPGFQGTTVLIFDSEPGDYVGQGGNRTLTPLDGTFLAARNDHQGVTVSFRTPEMLSYLHLWRLDFSSNEAPLVAGTYAAATAYPATPLNGLNVSGSGRGCSSLTGRFIVYEAVYRSDGSVRRFAADFEQHCNDSVPALFGAIRYNSTIASAVPFGGDYPSYRLDVSTTAGGRVIGGGLDCRVNGPVCQVSLLSASQVAIVALPDAGSVFAGWAGDCRGASSTSVHVNGPKACTAVFEPLVPSSPRTFLYVDSQPGDYIGGGRRVAYNVLNSRWTAVSAGAGNYVRVATVNGIDDWRLEFSAPAGQPLTVGNYTAARRSAFTTFNGLDVSSSSHGCNDLTGRFVILDIALAPDGTVLRFAADFEQHCNDDAAGLVGAVRYNSAAGEAVPFGGAYPLYQLSMAPPTGGRVMAIGLACGGSSMQCVLTLPVPARVGITAIPDPDYTFMGWTEDCSGGLTMTLHLNSPKRCAALFEPIAPIGPRTVLRWISQPGHYIGEGRSETFSSANSTWLGSASQDRSGVAFTVNSVGPRTYSHWTLYMNAPLGDVLQVGRRYAGAANSPTASVPGISIVGNGRSCGGGEFTVREVSFGAQNHLLAFSATFVLNCGSPSGPVLNGSLQYNSDLLLPATTLTVDPASLSFAAMYSGATTVLAPSPQTVRLTISDPNARWIATANAPWIHASPAAGTGGRLITVTLDVAAIPPGSGSAAGTIDVLVSDGSGATHTIGVRLNWLEATMTSRPFGHIDSPAGSMSGVTGAIPITGWALDDIDVTSVTICRAGVAGEATIANPNCGGAAQIFVGQAVFIEGARPDVQSLYQNYPRNNRAGWGVMVLTNMLPNQGNGQFQFSVYARDREGGTALLGTRTLICDNAHATVPFGTIDTPTQGQTISGTSYVNFGWALTPNPKQIPLDGSTLMVYVDGVPIGHPSYNHYRSDIATLFPGLANSTGAVGFMIVDTTALPDGLHTMVWTATDSAGVTSGLGSRYFRVANGANSAAGSTGRAFARAIPVDVGLDNLSLDRSPLVGRRGWDLNAPWQQYRVGPSGRAIVRGEEIDRFELALYGQPGETFAGYLRVSDRLAPLPIGSRLDENAGRFIWSPGVGFVGSYDFVFIREVGGRAVARREVRILLKPKGSGHVGAQVVIDIPAPGQDLVQPFALGGWAADLDAVAGTGIDVVHVWAYPAAGPPIFLGSAQNGGSRPDVAAVHGHQYEDSGFGLVVQGLSAGTYDLAVFPWSNVSGGFLPAHVIRITVR